MMKKRLAYTCINVIKNRNDLFLLLLMCIMVGPKTNQVPLYPNTSLYYVVHTHSPCHKGLKSKWTRQAQGWGKHTSKAATAVAANGMLFLKFEVCTC